MPFVPVPCHVWLPRYGEPDEWGNPTVSYGERPDIVTRCCYAPGRYGPDTRDDIEEGRPHGVRVDMTFYLPKEVDADLRGAIVACFPPDDRSLSGKRFDVVGEPYSYSRPNTPGDYSWSVEGVRHLG
jgi:hypothetical protein